jgi:hypothetical protein
MSHTKDLSKSKKYRRWIGYTVAIVGFIGGFYFMLVPETSELIKYSGAIVSFATLLISLTFIVPPQYKE